MFLCKLNLNLQVLLEFWLIFDHLFDRTGTIRLNLFVDITLALNLPQM